MQSLIDFFDSDCSLLDAVLLVLPIVYSVLVTEAAVSVEYLKCRDSG